MTSPALRWGFPAALLAFEYLALSLLVDFPTAGPALRFATAMRVAVPVALGAGASGWLIARHGTAPAAVEVGPALPPWRPARPLLLHLAAFAATAWLTTRLFGRGDEAIGAGLLAAWAGCVAATATLALLTSAPAGWLARRAAGRLWAPLLAVATGLLTWRTVDHVEALWGVLGSGTLRAVAAVLRLLRSDVVFVPEEAVVGAGTFEVIVAPICSGVDGVGLVLVFQALWLSLARERLRVSRALALLPLGTVAALAANVIRIAALVLLGASGRAELALGAFHSKLGWLLFVAIAFATVAAAEHVPWLRRAPARGTVDGAGVPPRAAAYVWPLVAALAAALATSLGAVEGFDPLYGARVAAAALALLAARRWLPRPSLRFSWVAVLLAVAVAGAFLAMGGPDGAPLARQVAALGPGERAAWIAARVLGSCLVIPVVEELAFRGFLLPWLVQRDFEAVSPRAFPLHAVALSSLAFGALHSQWVLATLAGVAFAAARAWRGRLGDAILAHAVCNAVLAVAVLAGGRWELWS